LQKVLILPVEFEDVQNSVSLQHVASLANQSSNYIMAASYNQTSLSMTIAKSWTRLNGTFAEYRYSSDLSGCPNLVRDSLSYFQEQFAISSYDHIVIIHAGDQFYAMRPEELAGQVCSSNNIVVRSVIVVSEGDNYLSLTHELMHSIGGYFVGPSGALTPWVQDLYSERAFQEHVISSIYVDSWDLMSDEMNGLTGWTKLKLGWIQPSQAVTLYSWSDTVVNLSAMETSGGTKVVQIPIGYSKVSFQNGTAVNAWSYYFVEYRNSMGIDKNLTSTVLVTLGNDTRFYYRLPGPLIESSHLDIGNTVWVTYNQLDLTIVLFKSNSHSALVAFLKPNQVHSFLDAAGEVNQALQAVQGHAQVVQSWSYVHPLLRTMQDLASGSLASLIKGNLSSASSQAEQAISSLQMWQSGTSQMLWVIAGVFDLAAALAFIVVGVYRRPKVGTDRQYVFNSKGLLLLVLILIILVSWSANSELLGLSLTDAGISSGSLSGFTQGLNSIGSGIVLAVLGSTMTGYYVRRSWEVYEV